MPCIPLQTGIPIELLERGIGACMRSAHTKPEAVQEAWHDALYYIREEIEGRIHDGMKMQITYYKQARRK